MPKNSIFSMPAVNNLFNNSRPGIAESTLHFLLDENIFSIRENTQPGYLSVDYKTNSGIDGSIDYCLTTDRGWIKSTGYTGAVAIDKGTAIKNVDNLFHQIHDEVLLTGMKRLYPTLEAQSKSVNYENYLMKQFYSHYYNMDYYNNTRKYTGDAYQIFRPTPRDSDSLSSHTTTTSSFTLDDYPPTISPPTTNINTAAAAFSSPVPSVSQTLTTENLAKSINPH